MDRLKRARKNYRESPEGKAQHADEEKDRRQRRKRESVGDQPGGETTDLGSVRGQEVAPVAELQSRDVRAEEAGVEAARSLLTEEVGAVASTAERATATLSMRRAVTLVFPRGLRAMAKALLGTRVACGVCGRSGVVTSLRLETKRRRR